MTRNRDTALLGGRFLDRARAQDAFDAIIGEESRSSSDVEVVFHGSSGQYFLLVAVKSSRAEDWAARVLREHGAIVQERQFPDRLSEWRTELVHDVGRAGQRGSEARTLRARWATMAILFMQEGLIEPPDLLALVLASRGQRDALPADEKQRRLMEADEELREVIERPGSVLRARHPELFDRRGQLRKAELARYLASRTGGKEVLSGDELRLLEDDADAAAARSGRAP